MEYRIGRIVFNKSPKGFPNTNTLILLVEVEKTNMNLGDFYFQVQYRETMDNLETKNIFNKTEHLKIKRIVRILSYFRKGFFTSNYDEDSELITNSDQYRMYKEGSKKVEMLNNYIKVNNNAFITIPDNLKDKCSFSADSDEDAFKIFRKAVRMFKPFSSFISINGNNFITEFFGKDLKSSILTGKTEYIGKTNKYLKRTENGIEDYISLDGCWDRWSITLKNSFTSKALFLLGISKGTDEDLIETFNLFKDYYKDKNKFLIPLTMYVSTRRNSKTTIEEELKLLSPCILMFSEAFGIGRSDFSDIGENPLIENDKKKFCEDKRYFVCVGGLYSSYLQKAERFLTNIPIKELMSDKVITLKDYIKKYSETIDKGDDD